MPLTYWCSRQSVNAGLAVGGAGREAAGWVLSAGLTAGVGLSVRFYVALTCGRGTSGEPPADVALELCVRFRDRQVLRRACVSGSWGDVDRAVPFFPFIRDQPFKMEIHCELSRFRVFVDGQQLFDFSHALTSLGDVDTLWIKGCVAVTKLA